YRFVELYYRRSESTHKGRAVPARVETVVLFLPDVWSCEEEPPSDKLEPTHYSQLDPKSMLVSALRNELKARNVNSKGLKSQLVARLAKALKAEAEKAEDPSKEVQQEADYISADEKKVETEEKKLDEKEKALLEKRYSLPEQQHILVHPSRTAKSGKFDCTTMSLSLLLDYRPEDTKEHSFEVSLFAELFNEMLMRDFGFNIYRALFELPDKEEKKEEKDQDNKDKEKKVEETNKDDKKEKKEELEKKKEQKKDDKKSDESEDDEEYDDEDSKDKKKDKEKKKKERVKMYTKDKHLLLSFIYFDQTHCGYIFDKDIEDLLYTLGLNLSRAQVRKLVGKVVTRDSLHYRKLTDKPKDSNEFILIEDTEKESNLHDLAVGNKKLLPIFVGEESPPKKTKVNGSGSEDAPSSEDGLVTFRGALVDVGKLMSQLERSEKARMETETRMVSLKNENNKLSDKYNKSNTTIKHLNSDLKEYKEKLRNTEDTLSRVTAYSKLYQTTLVEIREKIDPVLKSTSNNKEEQVACKKENDNKDKKHEESKTRWEKEVKQEEVMEVEQNEIKKEL
ncbi:cell division cycle and apoptosis regulator protein 1-like, partial [Asbolus verrucosus]